VAQAAAIDGLRGEDNLPTFEEEVEVSSKAAIAIVLEEAAKVARMRRNYWDQKSNLHEASANYPYISADISCALSLSEECGDIANAIRALGEK
jgi:hypothetical protein